MPLDEFDRTMLEEKGEASRILKQFLDIDISPNSAKKYMAGIRAYLNHKLQQPGSRRAVPGQLDEICFKADGSRTTQRMLLLSEEDSKDPTRIMALMGYDPLQWTLIECSVRRNYWDVTMKMKNGDSTYAEKQTNHAYLINVRVKPLQTIITSDFVKKIFENMKPPALTQYHYKAGGMMLELPILDFHLGKLSWNGETGDDYDIGIAVKRYKATVNDILGRVKGYGLKIEKIVFPIGNDYFHMDSTTNTTTAGTPMDSDTRWQKMYVAGTDLLVWTIEQLRAVAPVDIMYVPGNHDKMLGFTATCHVEAYYRNEKSVAVNVSAKPRKYVQYGQCLIGYSHGREEGKRIQFIMQEEAPQAWGTSRFREWHLGDLHIEDVGESGGIIIRRVSAICASDAWHTEMGFVGAVQKAQAFVWDANLGLQLVINSFQGVKMT